jgi:hypothetical protein
MTEKKWEGHVSWVSELVHFLQKVAVGCPKRLSKSPLSFPLPLFSFPPTTNNNVQQKILSDF